MIRANRLFVVAPLIAALAVAPSAAPHRAAVRPPIARVVLPAAQKLPFAQPPPGCFAATGCPGMQADICFASAVRSQDQQAKCPRRTVRYRYAGTRP